MTFGLTGSNIMKRVPMLCSSSTLLPPFTSFHFPGGKEFRNTFRQAIGKAKNSFRCKNKQTGWGEEGEIATLILAALLERNILSAQMYGNTAVPLHPQTALKTYQQGQVSGRTFGNQALQLEHAGLLVRKRQKGRHLFLAEVLHRRRRHTHDTSHTPGSKRAYVGLESKEQLGIT